MSNRLRILFLGGKQAGLIGLLTAIAADCHIQSVVTNSKVITDMTLRLNLPTYHSVKQDEVLSLLPVTDLIISVHSREIVPTEILSAVRLGGINVHPCLKEYKGKDPIQRFLGGNSSAASVGVHRMTEDIDMGETLHETFVEIDKKDCCTPADVYNILYPIYSLVLFDILRRFQNA